MSIDSADVAVTVALVPVPTLGGRVTPGDLAGMCEGESRGEVERLTMAWVHDAVLQGLDAEAVYAVVDPIMARVGLEMSIEIVP